MNSAHKLTIAGAAALFATLVGTWKALDPWPRFGWETPMSHDSELEQLAERHDRDIAELRSTLEEKINSNSITMQVFRDEGQCARYSRELSELYEKANGSPDQRTRDQIMRQRALMDSRTCDRFGNY